MIEDALFESCGISARVTVIRSVELSGIINENSIAPMAMDPSRLLVTILSNPSDAKRLKSLEKKNWKPEALAIGKRAVYQWCPDGILASKLAQAIGRELGDAATARNWATMMKLDAIANESE